jgi:hypothetical protein
MPTDFESYLNVRYNWYSGRVILVDLQGVIGETFEVFVDLDDLPTDFGGVGGEAWVGWAGLLGLVLGVAGAGLLGLVFGGFWVEGGWYRCCRQS